MNFTIPWGWVTAILPGASRLPYNVSVNFIGWGSNNETGYGDGIYGFEDWPVLLTAGSNIWSNYQNDSSQLPYCKEGGWDNGNAAEAAAVTALQLLRNDTFQYVSFYRGHWRQYVHVHMLTLDDKK
jgi:hypothetical protein